MGKLIWNCRKCVWSGTEPDSAGANNGGYFYRAPLCPNCGLYFNDADFKTVAVTSTDGKSP